MNNPSNEEVTRIQFLLKVIEKEIKLVHVVAEKLFVRPFTEEIARQLDESVDVAITLEAFTSRFCRLQDMIGDKLLPNLLKYFGEHPAPFLINLNKAEQLGWLDSAEEWVALRELRNQMIHEYIENASLLVNAVNTAHNHLHLLTVFATKLKAAFLNMEATR
jgi:hypothetical protein